MKFVFSLLLTTSLCQARPVILVTYGKHQSRARRVVQALTDKMNFPAVLVKAQKQSPPCHKKKQAIIHLCVDEDDTLKAPHIRRDVLARNLREFYTKEKSR